MAARAAVVCAKGSGGLRRSQAPSSPSCELCSALGKAGPGQGARCLQLSRGQVQLGNVDNLEAPVVSRAQFGDCGALTPACSKVGSSRELSVS